MFLSDCVSGYIVKVDICCKSICVFGYGCIYVFVVLYIGEIVFSNKRGDCSMYLNFSKNIGEI